jgi:hypothetical protein
VTAHTKAVCEQLKQGDTTMFTKTAIVLAIIVSTVSGALAADRQRTFNPSWPSYDSDAYFGRAWARQPGPAHGMCGCAE